MIWLRPISCCSSGSAEADAFLLLDGSSQFGLQRGNEAFQIALAIQIEAITQRVEDAGSCDLDHWPWRRYVTAFHIWIKAKQRLDQVITGARRQRLFLMVLSEPPVELN